MTRRKPLPELTGTELEVMKALWPKGKLSAREIHERLGEGHGWATSTTRTILERMVAKGLVAKGSFHGLYLYEPRISRPLGLARRVRSFAEEVLELEWAPVVSLFARSQALSAEEVEELSRLLEAMDREEVE